MANQMSNARFNEWLTVAANIAVMLGLIVLIFEIRANTAAMITIEHRTCLQRRQ